MVEIGITKPPIPLIWLDTWVFNALGRMRAGILPPEEQLLFRALFDVLLKLRDQTAILCPETGQFVEIQPVGWSIEEAKSALSMLSGGVKTYHQRIVDAQNYRAMQAYAHGRDVIEVSYKTRSTATPFGSSPSATFSSASTSNHRPTSWPRRARRTRGWPRPWRRSGRNG